MVDLPDAIQDPDTREDNLVQKVLVVLHLGLFKIYLRADLLAVAAKSLADLINSLLFVTWAITPLFTVPPMPSTTPFP